MFETRELKYIPQGVAASITTDTGCVRESNEDRARHISPNDAKTLRKRGTLTIVADGMGGHASGEVASQMAIELISEYYYADQTSDAPEALRRALELANAEIYAASLTEEKYFGMGTTVIALVLLDKTAYAAHVGDSRLYRLRGGKLERLTIDHSQVMEMFRQGIISWEETKDHDDKNIILRAVGTQKDVEVEISAPFAVEPNDAYLLCSDGLCDMLDDEEIAEIWSRSPDVHKAGERLVECAKDNGGHDNVTAAVLRIPAAREAVVSRNVPTTRETGALKS